MTAETACKSRFYEGYKKIFLITEKNISLKLSFFKNYSIEDRRGRFIGQLIFRKLQFKTFQPEKCECSCNILYSMQFATTLQC